MPCYPGWGESSMYPGIRRPGPYGGFLGSQYEPLFALSLSTHPPAQQRLDQLAQAMGERLAPLGGKPSVPLAQRLAR